MEDWNRSRAAESSSVSSSLKLIVVRKIALFVARSRASGLLTIIPSATTMQVGEPVIGISLLPVEVLAEIFKSAATTGTGCLKTYSAVSRRWRSSCLEHPDLWTNIRPFEMRDAVAWTEVSLERSKSCLFDVTLHLPDINRQPEYMSIVSCVMLLVVQHVHRLHRLTIKADDVLSNPAEIFAPLQNAQRSPNLKVLDLDFFDPYPSISTTIPQNSLLLEAPLSSLRLHGVASPVALVGLTRLDIQGMQTTYADFRDMVVASPLLAELILPKLRQMVDLQSTSLPPIEIPSLKRLALSFSRPLPNGFAPRHNLLSFLRAPNLEYLELAGGHIPDLAKCFQDPNTFTRLRTLRLLNASLLTTAIEADIDNSVYLRALKTVEDLQLIHSLPHFLLPTQHDVARRRQSRLSRTRSTSNLAAAVGASALHPAPVNYYGAQTRGATGGLLEPTESASIYPNLRSVSFDALPASQALWLYQLVLERPEIQEVRVSQVIERHLTTSLAIVDGVLQPIPHSMHLKRLGSTGHEHVDVGKLLREKVSVKKLQTDGYIQ